MSSIVDFITANGAGIGVGVIVGLILAFISKSVSFLFKKVTPQNLRASYPEDWFDYRMPGVQHLIVPQQLVLQFRLNVQNRAKENRLIRNVGLRFTPEQFPWREISARHLDSPVLPHQITPAHYANLGLSLTFEVGIIVEQGQLGWLDSYFSQVEQLADSYELEIFIESEMNGRVHKQSFRRSLNLKLELINHIKTRLLEEWKGRSCPNSENEICGVLNEARKEANKRFGLGLEYEGAE